EGYPAHHLAEDIVARSAPHLPDAGVGALPVPRDPLHQAAEDPPGAFGHGMRLAPDRGCLEHFAVDVELQLAGRAVADADRPRVHIAREVVEHGFLEVPPAIDAIHDLQVAAALVATDPFQKTHEGVR